MPTIAFITGAPPGEILVGRGHPTLADVLNRPLIDVLTRSGVDITDPAWPGFLDKAHADTLYSGGGGGGGGTGLSLAESDARYLGLSSGGRTVLPIAGQESAPMVTLDSVASGGHTGGMIRLIARETSIGHPLELWAGGHMPETGGEIPMVYWDAGGGQYTRGWLSFAASGVDATTDPFMIAIQIDIPGYGIAMTAPRTAEVDGGAMFSQYFAVDRTTKLFRHLPNGEPHVQVPGLGYQLTSPNGTVRRIKLADDGTLSTQIVSTPLGTPTAATPTPTALNSLHIGDSGTLKFYVINEFGVAELNDGSTVLEMHSTDTAVITATPANSGTDSSGNTDEFTYTALASGTASLQLRRSSDHVAIGSCAVTVAAVSSGGFVEDFTRADDPTGLGNSWIRYAGGDILGILSNDAYMPSPPGAGAFYVKDGASADLRVRATFIYTEFVSNNVFVFANSNSARTDAIFAFHGGTFDFWIYELIGDAAVNGVHVFGSGFDSGDELGLQKEMDGTWTVTRNGSPELTGYTPGASHTGTYYGIGTSGGTDSVWRCTQVTVD